MVIAIINQDMTADSPGKKKIAETVTNTHRPTALEIFGNTHFGGSLRFWPEILYTTLCDRNMLDRGNGVACCVEEQGNAGPGEGLLVLPMHTFITQGRGMVE